MLALLFFVLQKKKGENKMSLRKTLSLLLICIMLAAMLPVQAFADLNSSQTAKFKEGGVLYDAYGRTYHYDRQYYIQVYQYNSDGSRRKIILDNENTSPKRSFLITQGGSSYRGYCIEHGVYSDETLNMKALTGEGSISFYKGLSKSQQKNIQLALLYGWQSGKSITDTKDTLFTSHLCCICHRFSHRLMKNFQKDCHSFTMIHSQCLKMQKQHGLPGMTSLILM